MKSAYVPALLLAAILLTPFGQSHSQETVKGGKSNTGTVYRNTPYGFTFTLPDSWRRYRVLQEIWQSDECSYCSSHRIEHGPIIVIRNPHWTSTNAWVDIPILVLTITQSQELESGDISLSGAAPVGPGELGRNGKYVFYLPTRFGAACEDCPGYDEVNNHILAGRPLRPLPIEGFPSQPNLLYVNHNYGFSVTLPRSWKHYSVVQASWCKPDGSFGEDADSARCQIVVLRHVLQQHSAEPIPHPYEDIPVVILTLVQWKQLQHGDLVIGSDQDKLSKLGRNGKYVFALLPPDYHDFVPAPDLIFYQRKDYAFHAFRPDAPVQ
jgi:hypothetical protein